MNDLVVKNVNLFGDMVTAAQDKDGNIWVGIRWLCRGLGMTDGQFKRQITNIKGDAALGKVGSNLILPTGGGNKPVFCLRNDYIPLWLAKVSITPTMQKETPDLADKLLEYQLKAKDVLAAAFVQKKSYAPANLSQQIQLIAQGHIELQEEVNAVKQDVTDIRQDMEDFKLDMPLFPTDLKRLRNCMNKRVVKLLGGKQSNAYRDRSITQSAYYDAYTNNLNASFGVSSYMDIKRRDLAEALDIIEHYSLPYYLQKRVDTANGEAA